MTKYVVYGLGSSGISAIKFFVKNGQEVIATDDNFQSIENIKTKLLAEDSAVFSAVKFLKPEEISFDAHTVISFAPGIPLYFPTPHKILEIVKKTGAKLSCDIEIFYQQNRKQNFLAITGTNGKSTTTALTGFIFKELNLSSELGGNIGVPCFDLPDSRNLEKSQMTYILEMSSYQLDLIDESHFKVAAFLNITPDHIDRHGSLVEYIKAKKRIFKNQIAGDYTAINVDNVNSKAVFEEMKNDKNFDAKLVPISTENINEGGVSTFNGKLYNRIEGENSEFVLGEIFLKGQHNAENISMAFALTYCHLKQQNLLEKIQQSQIIEAIKKFKGLRHRMQFLGSVADVNFVNDSKATNAESAENALKAYKNIFWILGGRSKEGGITSLTPYFNKVVKAYLIGEASEDFAKTLEKNSVAFEKCDNLKNAIEKSFADAKNHGLKEKNILLSPACASLDQWKNFEERGDFFCKTFDELQNF